MGEPFHDRAFIQRLRSGDEAAFEQVFHACYARVLGAAYRLLGNGAAAEEVTQEAFIRLHRTPPAATDNANLLGWLVTVAVNLSYNQLRADRRRREREERAGRMGELATPATDIADRVEEVERVRRVLAGLPQRQALILLLRHSGLSYAEVAEQLDVAPGSVGTLLARAERAFRENYEELERGGSHAEQP